ncbi:MAG: hypothetical protein H7Z12_02090 [Rhodospirillaceae bacterium]|nr:hypothetical protein [Rhodospirillales bacterium]
MPVRTPLKAADPDTLATLAAALRAIARDHKSAAPVLHALAKSYDLRAQTQNTTQH